MNRMLRLLALPLALLLLSGLAARPLQAAELLLNPVRDTSVFQGEGFDNSADGAGPHLWTSVTAGGFNRRALLAFDLRAVPIGSTVLSVELRLFQSRARDSHPVALYRLLESWGEGRSNAGGAGTGAPATPGDATWIHRFHPGSPWTQAGGRFEAQASDVQTVGLPGETYRWGSTARMVSDVQRWVNDPTQNHGWVLIGVEDGTQNAKRFESRENSAAVNRPQLRVVYTPPPASDPADIPLPPWAWGLLAGGIAWRLGRKPRAPAPPEPPV